MVFFRVYGIQTLAIPRNNKLTGNSICQYYCCRAHHDDRDRYTTARRWPGRCDNENQCCKWVFSRNEHRICIWYVEGLIVDSVDVLTDYGDT
jgi:hypothetical protein